jgi:ribonucleoside-triphosphate reductase
LIQAIAEDIQSDCNELTQTPSVEDVQDMVENYLIKYGAAVVARNYITYRYKRMLARKANTTDDAILSLIDLQNEEAKQENANKNPTINSTQRDYMAGEVSKDLTNRILLPKDIVEAHQAGIIHFHDSDYFAQRMYNCCLINLEEMLQHGTVISGKMIEPPKSFHTACNITTQIVAQVASNQYGGQTFTLAHLVPFVEVSRQKIRNKVKEELSGLDIAESRIEKIVQSRLHDEIKSGVQLIQYQLITLMTTNGQAPFVSMYMYLDEVDESMRDDCALIIEEVLKQRMQGVKNENGVWITPEFPKLLYVLDEDNVHENSKYFYLTELAARCTAKRMVPDYISAKMMRKLKNGDVYGCMGCRSFLTPDRFEKNLSRANSYKEGKHQYYGRFNQGVVTLNLPDVACASGGDFDKFWEIFEERLELCHRALRCRHERLLGTVSDVAPLLWQHGALARLKSGEKIDHLLYDGYSTISLGYTGLYECCVRMTGKSHTDGEAKPFAIAVMQKMNDKCAEWKAAENIDYSLYGTPMESTTYKFAKATRKRYGVIKDVTDHNYQTNSYHVVVREEIDAFTKLAFEAEFQHLSPGGAISYVEVPNMQHNIPAVISIIQHMYDTIMYAEMNTKSDYCQVCGYDGEILIVEDEDTKKLVWECPNCKNRDHDKMNVARRVCGYIGSNEMNQGRMGDIKDRVLHVS